MIPALKSQIVRRKLVDAMELNKYREPEKTEYLELALSHFGKEAFVAIMSWVPESEYSKIEQLINAGQNVAAENVVLRHVSEDKVWSIIDGIIENGGRTFKELLQK
jgi:hypothetical protein